MEKLIKFIGKLQHWMFFNVAKVLYFLKSCATLFFRLPWPVGAKAFLGLLSGFIKAEKYRKWDGWSLTPENISVICQIISQNNIKHIIEFGAGYSTVVLSEYLSYVSPQTCIDSFEHQAEFAENIEKFLPRNNKKITLHCPALVQVSDEIFERIFISQNPLIDFSALFTLVPQDKVHETRLENAFYGFDFNLYEPRSFDLIILDGPNGNGRSMAFPLLKNLVCLPCWVIIDDYLDYPFLEDMKRIFYFDVICHVEVKDKEWIVLKISGLVGESINT
jgi:hypothetical protein